MCSRYGGLCAASDGACVALLECFAELVSTPAAGAIVTDEVSRNYPTWYDGQVRHFLSDSIAPVLLCPNPLSKLNCEQLICLLQVATDGMRNAASADGVEMRGPIRYGEFTRPGMPSSAILRCPGSPGHPPTDKHVQIGLAGKTLVPSIFDIKRCSKNERADVCRAILCSIAAGQPAVEQFILGSITAAKRAAKRAATSTKAVTSKRRSRVREVPLKRNRQEDKAGHPNTSKKSRGTGSLAAPTSAAPSRGYFPETPSASIPLVSSAAAAPPPAFSPAAPSTTVYLPTPPSAAHPPESSPAPSPSALTSAVTLVAVAATTPPQVFPPAPFPASSITQHEDRT